MAAISGARRNALRKNSILIIEKNKMLGRKISVTGNGRCNLTNQKITIDKYFGANTKCLHGIFSRFSSKDTMEFFEEIGVRLKVEEQGRAFPVTNQSSTVVDLLNEEVSRLGINLKLEERVILFNRVGNIWKVKTNKGLYQAPRIILSAGSRSYPQIGTTGDGYVFCRRLGHTITELKPALVPLELNGNWFHKLQGVKCDVELILSGQDKIIRKETGEILFTNYGISGPVVLNLSRLIVDFSLEINSQVLINFFPGFDAGKLADFLYDRWGGLISNNTLLISMFGLLPKKLCKVLLKELKLPFDLMVSKIAQKELHHITERLTQWVLSVKKSRPFTESMITAGGVPTDEINIKTMESLKARGLYLAGEILDIDGVSGGYNLQFAWSTGHIAGISAVEK